MGLKVRALRLYFYLWEVQVIIRSGLLRVLPGYWVWRAHWPDVRGWSGAIMNRIMSFERYPVAGRH